MKITVERNQDNFANIVLNVDGKTLRMYPERNIKQRVAKEVAAWLKKNDARLHILIGVGLGYHLESLFNSTKGRSEYLLIEPVEEIASIADRAVNLRSVEKLPNVTYLVYNRSNPSEFVKGLKHYFASPRQFLVENAAFHIPVFYQSNFAELTREVAKIILRVVQQTLGEGGNSVDDAILGVYNILRNASHIASSWKLRHLQNRYRDVPAVVVSAGPSLDKNIRLLKNAQHRVLIIGEDATYSKLLKEGILPDFILVLERDHITYEKFFKHSLPFDLTQPVLLCQSVVWPEIPRIYRGPVAFTFKSAIPLERHLCEKLGTDFLHLDSGSSVAVMGISLAHFLGSNPIILIGQDLAFSEDGYTHAEGVAVRAEAKSKTDVGVSIVELPGIFGKPVKSTTTWRLFKNQIENLILQKKLTVIDATEGGALIEKAKIMKLKDALNSIPSKAKQPVSELILPPDSSEEAARLQTVVSVGNQWRETLDKCADELSRKIDANEDINVLRTTFEKMFSRHEIVQVVIQPLLKLMYIHLSRNNPKKAREAVQNASEVMSLASEYVQKGLSLAENYDKLVEELQSRECETQQCFLEKIDSFVKNGFPFKALDCIQQAIEKGFESPEIYKIKALIRSSNVIEKASDIRDCFESSKKAAELNPNIFQDTEFIQKISSVLKNYAEALRDLLNSRFLELQDKKKAALETIKMFAITNMNQEGISLLERYKDILKDREDYYRAGFLLYKTISPEKAREILKEGLSRFPDDEVLKDLAKQV